MRIRTIKPEFWQSESVSRLSRDARLLFIGLWNLADDYGRLRAAPQYVIGQLFAYDSVNPAECSGWISEIVAEKMLSLYEADGCQYAEVCKWSEHQKIDRRSKPKIPAPPNHAECSGGSAEILPRNREQGTGNREQGSGREQGGDAGDFMQDEDIPVAKGTTNRPPPPAHSLADWFMECKHLYVGKDEREDFQAMFDKAGREYDSLAEGYEFLISAYRFCLDKKEGKGRVYLSDLRREIRWDSE